MKATPDEGEFSAALFSALQFPVYVTDAQTLRLVYVNPVMAKKTGAEVGQECHKAIYRQYSPCSFCRLRDMTDPVHPVKMPLVFDHFNEVDDKWYQLQESLIEWSDRRIFKSSEEAAVEWVDRRVFKSSIAIDISVLKAVQNELAEAHAELSLKNRALECLAATDSLTGLFNRRTLDAKMEHEHARVQRHFTPFSVILADIDHFKSINDTYGHQEGDRVLCALADVLKNDVREADMVGRWGGEEFMILCPNTTINGAALLAEHLRQQIVNSATSGQPFASCSFGVAEMVLNDTIGELVARADAALYRAKKNGRNQVEMDFWEAKNAGEPPHP